MSNTTPDTNTPPPEITFFAWKLGPVALEKFYNVLALAGGKTKKKDRTDRYICGYEGAWTTGDPAEAYRCENVLVANRYRNEWDSRYEDAKLVEVTLNFTLEDVEDDPS